MSWRNSCHLAGARRNGRALKSPVIRYQIDSYLTDSIGADDGYLSSGARAWWKTPSAAPVPLECNQSVSPPSLLSIQCGLFSFFFFFPFYSGNIARTQHCDTRLGIDSASVRCQCGASAVPEAQLNQR